MAVWEYATIEVNDQRQVTRVNRPDAEMRMGTPGRLQRPPLLRQLKQMGQEGWKVVTMSDGLIVLKRRR